MWKSHSSNIIDVATTSQCSILNLQNDRHIHLFYHTSIHDKISLVCSESSPLMQRSSSEHMFDTMAMEIEQLLSKVLLTCFQKEMLEKLCTFEIVCEHIKQVQL